MTNTNEQNDTSTPRPPVVGIFGHIDHGKSSLLDYIRKSNVVEKEAGGITQHISAYEITHEHEGKSSQITFLDTPGHVAFSGIRTRGASVADIAVLVVSGEDGVKPQTLEVYKHIQKSSLPFVVAITKIDKPEASLDRTKSSLAEAGIYVEGFGGTVPVVGISSKTGKGVPELLDMILLLSDLNELKGDRDALGSGVIIESKLDPKRGITATALIKNGTVRKSTFAATPGSMAVLRYILDAESKQVEELSFSSPIQITGWDKMPKSGSEFKTFLKKDEALAYAKTEQTTDNRQPTREMGEGMIILPLIIKADTAGSLEAVENEIGKLSRERIVPKVTSSGVGAINENDVKGAVTTPGTVLLALHAKTENAAGALALRSGINIESFDLIYELVERVGKLLEEREPRIEVEEVLGNAKVIRIFSIDKSKQVIGARVLSGKFAVGANLKIIRRESEIGRGRLRELQQAKVKTSEVAEGSEFGALVEAKVEITPGDTLEATILVTK